MDIGKTKRVKNIVIITGDVHHRFRENWIKEDESMFIRKYLDLINRYGYIATLFVTGKLLKEKARFFNKILKEYDVEIQPHTYSVFSSYSFKVANFLKKHGFKKLYKTLLINDVKRAIDAYAEIGLDVYAWRTHSYIVNNTIYSALLFFSKSTTVAVLDFRKYIKDVVYACRILNVQVNNLNLRKRLLFIPINVPVDDYIIIYLKRRRFDKIREYCKVVANVLEKLIARNQNLVIQCHPSVAKVTKYETLHFFLEVLKEHGYKSIKIKDFIKKLI